MKIFLLTNFEKFWHRNWKLSWKWCFFSNSFLQCRWHCRIFQLISNFRSFQSMFSSFFCCLFPFRQQPILDEWDRKIKSNIIFISQFQFSRSRSFPLFYLILVFDAPYVSFQLQPVSFPLQVILRSKSYRHHNVLSSIFLWFFTRNFHFELFWGRYVHSLHKTTIKPHEKFKINSKANSRSESLWLLWKLRILGCLNFSSDAHH